MDNTNESNCGEKILKVGQVPEVDTALPVTVMMRAYYSSYHLWAARHLSVLASSIENEEMERPQFDIKHRAYVTNSIFSAVAFLEAVINELFQDVADGHESYVRTLDANSKRLMSDFWQAKAKKRRPGVLKKYQEALRVLGKQQFDSNQLQYQDVTLVRDLRNNLVHYQPKSLGGDAEHDLVKRLGGKFLDNRLMNGSGNPWFPDKCLGHGCAEWSIRSVTEFADEFFGRIGVVPNYQQVQFQPSPNDA